MIRGCTCTGGIGLKNQKRIAAMQRADDPIATGQQRGIEQRPRKGAASPSRYQASGQRLINIGADTVFAVNRRRVLLQSKQVFRACGTSKSAGLCREKRQGF